MLEILLIENIAYWKYYMLEILHIGFYIGWHWGRFQYCMPDQNQLDFINGQLCYLAIQVIIS